MMGYFTGHRPSGFVQPLRCSRWRYHRRGEDSGDPIDGRPVADNFPVMVNKQLETSRMLSKASWQRVSRREINK